MTALRTGLEQRQGQLPGPLGAGPVAARLWLGARLRRLREEAGISRAGAAAGIRASASKISRMELGRSPVKEQDLAGLLALYGVADEAERAAMRELSLDGSLPGWWQAYGDAVPAWAKPYLGMEQAARLIRSYDVQFISGLLQTPDYARAIVGLSASSSSDQAERQVAVQMRRQEILHRADPPQLWAVVDEATLRRPVGGAAVMRAQVSHLLEISQLRHVNIQVLPFRAGGHAGGASIILLRFAGDQLPDVVYLEQIASAVYPSKRSELVYYWGLLNQLATQADPPIASIMILNQIRKEM